MSTFVQGSGYLDLYVVWNNKPGSLY